MNYYRQCKLKCGNTCQTSWIPEKFAKVGKLLKLDSKKIGEVKEVRKNTWVVSEVFGRIEEDWLREIESDYKNQRKMSDI